MGKGVIHLSGEWWASDHDDQSKFYVGKPDDPHPRSDDQMGCGRRNAAQPSAQRCLILRPNDRWIGSPS
ncbi:Uncharacterised protein [Vibrio cholerae]|nr:Uncharacterised protein [Vibrio cholerae]CSC97071.1 Uncharacterised protein [Vibrio cholerae]CSD37067.1 Uncharacterised protein [Vibrio cholerae]CSH93847.1 Uncharacterised protein [Vibrio cholerae]CSI30691.1 Uncharacterised protein [Vibrio cholerae]